jgi:prepilin-type N-terminal cleavage/methylation domain-containing protein
MHASGRAGFTLVEVMLAMLILGIAMGVLLTGASRCLAVMKVARNYQTAQWVMGMGEQEYPPSYTNDVKELNVDPKKYDNGYTFSRVVEDDDDEDGLFVVKTRVQWSERNMEAVEEVARLIYDEKSRKKNVR